MKEKNINNALFKLWVPFMDDKTTEQVTNITNLPNVFKHIAIMPDCHLGVGVPIGCVLAMKDTVIPNAVGVDIGCGMLAYNTGIKYMDKPILQEIVDEIKKAIPVGFNHQKEPQKWDGFDRAPIMDVVIQDQLEKASYQLGTLGGGNHFIEIQRGSDGFVWVMLHSGSRNFGLQIAQYYNKLAIEVNPDSPKQLAYFTKDQKEFNEYMCAMDFALEFAAENRMNMFRVIKKIIKSKGFKIDSTPPILMHHNFAKEEEHFGEKVIVHRKGATPAFKGVLGIIPGSQGTKSYIVEGLGNPESFMSCSHGAGRVLGRKQAKKTLDFETEKAILDNQGIIHSMDSVSRLDEAVSAYKNIGEVMANQADLVKIIVELSPLAVVKG